MIPLKSNLDVIILMYHSISDGPGPTCIPLQTFQSQLSALEAQGYQVISLKTFVQGYCGRAALPDAGRCVDI